MVKVSSAEPQINPIVPIREVPVVFGSTEILTFEIISFTNTQS